jgi:hypothetical protein
VARLWAGGHQLGRRGARGGRESSRGEPLQVHNRAGDLVERDGRTILTATLTSDFPGSTVGLIYEFTIADGAISALSIHLLTFGQDLGVPCSLFKLPGGG